MAVSDSVSERRTAFEAELAGVEPQIRGLTDKVRDDLSGELRAELASRLALLKERESMLRTALAQQEAADNAAAAIDQAGAIPPTQLRGDLMEELNREGADDAAARGGFEAEAQAANITVNLGQPGNV